MGCNGFLRGWYSKERTRLGKRRVEFKFKEAFHDLPVAVPCGKCKGCKLERSREWAVRCVHEAQLWKSNCFVTLTYNDEHLPRLADGLPTLRKEDFVLFMKRLRKVKPGVRFLQAGEYGKLGRPHHHAILFNCDFEDKEFLNERRIGRIFRSAELESLWPIGYSSVALFAFESAAYVARYTLKKVYGDDAAAFYRGRVPEYMTMSRRPGIGAGWFKKYMGDVFPADRVVVYRNLFPVLGKPPRYYDELYRRVNPEGFAEMKRRRIKAIDVGEMDDRRGNVREQLIERRIEDFLKKEL